MSERLTKRQLKHDRFLEIVQEVLAYSRHHGLVVAAALVVFVAGVAFAVRVAGQAAGPRAENPEAEAALSAARTQFATGNTDAGRTALEQVRSQHAGSKAAREATYILANMYYESGNWAQAAATFEEFLKKPLYDDLMQDGARMGLAACKEEGGDVAGAFDAYKALWTGAHHTATRIDAAMSAARCANKLGRPDDARSMYQAVADTYPDAPEADRAKFQLGALKS